MGWKTYASANERLKMKKKLLYDDCSEIDKRQSENMDIFILEKLFPDGKHASDYPNLLKKAKLFDIYFTTIMDSSLKETWKEEIDNIKIIHFVKYIKYVIKIIQFSQEDSQIVKDIDYICKFMTDSELSIAEKEIHIGSYLMENAENTNNPKLYRAILEEIFVLEKIKLL